MTTVQWAVTLVAIVMAILAIRHSMRLRKEVNQLKHQQFEVTSRLKNTVESFSAAIQPIRLHLAKIASGGMVSPELILSGQLFLEVSAAQGLEIYTQGIDPGTERVVIIDVRTMREFAERRLPGAKLVPFEDLDQQYEKDIPAQADKVLLYCAEGERGRMACEYLSKKGYTNLYHLRDGLRGWEGPTEGEGPITLIQIEKKNKLPVR